MCLHLSGLASQTLTYHHFIDIHMPKHMTQVRRKKECMHHMLTYLSPGIS